MIGIVSKLIRQGTGKQALKGNLVTVHYTGKLNNNEGKKFDSSRDRNTPFSFILGNGQVIKGWDEGILNKKEGDLVELTIPPEFGYGDRGVGPIPPKSTLYFEAVKVGDGSVEGYHKGHHQSLKYSTSIPIDENSWMVNSFNVVLH
ncbi:hypothetical protein ACTA71_005992 [Dictyostelium dimigraforme]